MDLESVILLDVLGEGRQDGDDGRRRLCDTYGHFDCQWGSGSEGNATDIK